MKTLGILLILLFIIFSCNDYSPCKNSEFLLGRYKLELGLLTSYNNNDSLILHLAKNNNWDKVELIVEEKNYHFEKCDDYFKKYEGTWEYKSMGFDGDCYVYINQKEGSRKIPLDPFNIAINFNGKTIILPFKKSQLR